MKKSLLLLALFATLFTYSLHAQVTLTVANGDAANEYIPVYGTMNNRYLREQVIYPAEMLSSINGADITSLTFYLGSKPSWTGIFEVKLGVTDNSAFPSSANAFLTESTTSLYTGTFEVSYDNLLTITFNTPFHYTGGNLLLDISTVQTGSSQSTTFMGMTSTRGSAYNYNSIGMGDVVAAYVRNFIPKTTFSFSLGDTCMHPFNIEASGTAGSSAIIQWKNATTFNPDHYEVSYKQANAESWTTAPDAVTTEYYILTGLQPETDYQLRVRAFCDATTPTDYSEPVAFSTDCSSGRPDDWIVGTTTSDYNSNYVPFYSGYRYNYCQMICTSEEMGGEKDLTALSLQYIYYAPITRNLDIYVGHTSLNTLRYDSYVPADDLTLVYSGEVAFNNSGEDFWFTIPFDTVFHYNGTDNLVVAFDDNNSTTLNNQRRFYMHSSGPSSVHRSLLFYSSNSDILPASPNSTGYSYNQVPNMKFTQACESGGCDAANVAVMEVTDNSARLVFTSGNGNTGLELEYKRTVDDTYTALPTNGTSYLLTGLRPNTEYQVRIRSVCSSGNSRWKQVEFTTGIQNFPRLYVTATGTGNGGSWATAYGDLNEAIAASDAIHKTYMTLPPDIWVAEGTYYGDSISASAFILREGINIYGGFAGNETEFSQRDFTAHPTVLDGQHSQRVLYQEDNFYTIPTVCDGFTIQNGYAGNNSYGGGAYLKYRMTLRHCIVRDNTATNSGGGIYIYSSNTGGIEHCTITRNTANHGGGIYCNRSSIQHCTVTHNVATGSGGGFNVEGGGNNTISNCLVANNTANYGGGIWGQGYSDYVCLVENTTIVRNSCSSEGGGIYLYPTLHNCIVWGNEKNGIPDNITSTSNSIECLSTAVEGGFSGEGNVVLMPESFDNGRYYPHFANPAATAGHTNSTENVDWHLLSNSICVNRGNDELVTIPDSTDLDGTARIKQGTVDMGCYESDYPGIPLPDYENVVYVTANGAGDRTGTSWENAIDNIANAILVAQTFNADVWVAEGVYYGDSVSTNAFEMVDGVSLYGGFAGNETELSQRDLAAHVTVLDGQHSQRVLNQPNVFTQTTHVDGFTFRNGYATTHGGGAYIQQGVHLSNCIFTHNRAENYGGGAYCYAYSGSAGGDTSTISHCSFIHNVAQRGGGLYGQSVQISDCLFAYDTANYGGGLTTSGKMVRCVIKHNLSYTEGGGMYGGGPVSQCEFTHNKSNNYGGGMTLTGSTNSLPALSNCLIANNTATYGGAGIHNTGSCSVRNLTVVCNNLTNSYTANNYSGAGILTDYANLTIQNSIFWGNRHNGEVNSLAKVGYSSQYLTTSHCAVEDGYDGDENITLLSDGYLGPHFANPALTIGNEDDTPNPDWHLTNGSPCVNRGDNSVADSLDLDGDARVQQGVVDLGCYESPYTAIALPTYDDGIVYVTEQGTGTGESWANAIGSIQDAISIAASEHAVVWVAAGTYYGNTEDGGNSGESGGGGESEGDEYDNTSDNNAFTMREGVSVYGGFAGNEPADYDLSLRDFTANTTILDGQGARRVLFQPANFTAATAVTWDGFTIQNGHSTGSGAGVYMLQYSTLSHCNVQYNTLESTITSSHYGGGIYASGSSVSVDGVTQRTTKISHCRIAYNVNHQDYIDGTGGGLYGVNVDIDHTEICHNTASTSGGGLYLSNKNQVSNCLIHHNSAEYGGGVYANSNSTFLHCDIVNNTTTSSGGGIYSYNNSTFTNCIIWGNKKNYAVNNLSSSGSFTYCAVEGGRTGTGNITLASPNDGFDGSQYYVRFIDPENDDYQLHPTSICVNAGNTEASTDSLDFYGYPRIHGGTVDIGCSEAQDESICPSVVGLTVDNVTATSAHLTWHPMGTENQWTVVYGQTGGEATTLTVSDTSYTLTGLLLNRNYSAKVRAVCSDGMLSIFSIPVNFQTECDPSILDTLSNFGLMTPSDSDLVYQSTISFSWNALPEATSYDFYLWADGNPEPATPTRSGLTVTAVNNVHLSNYERGKYYHWKVVAWNECISKSSPVMTLRASPGSDLHVSSVTHSTPVAGQPMTITWTVTNDGEGSTPPGVTWPDYIWISNDVDVRFHFEDANHNLATVTSLQSLNPGESYTNSTTVTLPEGIMGNYYLFVIAGEADASSIDFTPTDGVAPNPYTPSVTGDPYPYLFAGTHQIFFSDDIVFGCYLNEQGTPSCGNWGHDNFFYVMLNILPPPSPDLVVSSVAHPANTFSGTNIPLTWTVTNQGEATAIDSWYDVVYLSSDTALNIANAWRVGTYKHSGNLPVDSSYSHSINVTIPIDYMGDYRFFVITDYLDEIYESFYNENNIGVSEHPITVTLTPPADLIVTAIENMPDTVDVNASYSIRFTVKNNGSSPTHQNYWRDRFYISRDSVFDQNTARPLDIFPHNGVLAADSSYSKERYLGIPGDLEDGLWYIHLYTDVNNNIFEYVYEDNNVATLPVIVRVPDLVVTSVQVSDTVYPNTTVRVTWTVRNDGPGNVVSRSFTDHILFNGETVYTATVTHINLAMGDSMVRSANIQIPCSAEASTLSVVTDATEVILEGSEGNNTLTVPLHILMPDLTVTGVIIPYESLWSGTPVTVTYTVVNNGAVPVNDTVTDRFYFNDQTTGYAESDFSGSHTYVLTLDPGTSETFSCTMSVPNGISGQYYCHVAGNATGAVCETNPDNNTGHSAAVNVRLSPWPDLVVTNVTVGDTVNLGATFPVQYTVKNNGTADLHYASTYNKFYYSISPSQYDTNNLILTQMDYFNMAVGEEETHTALLSIPMTEMQRYYYIHIVADATDIVYEHTDEDNNTAVSNNFLAKVYELDVVAVEIDGPDVVEWGQTATYRLHVRNNSEVPTLALQWIDALYMSNDQALQNNDIYIQSVSHQAQLDAGEDYWVNFTYTFPFGTPSSVYLLGYADFNSENPDINPSNNSAVKALTVNSVPTPDLAVTEAAIVGEIYSGQPAKMTYTVTNVGELDINSQTWRDKLFLSNDDTYESNDIELLTKPRQNVTLPQGGSYTDTLTFTVPLPQNGSFYLIVKTNTLNNPFEANQDNNTMALPANIQLPNPGDLTVTDITSESSIESGGTLHVSWNVENIGDNPITGHGLRSLVYISVDNSFDVNDRLIGNVVVNNIHLGPDETLAQTAQCRISGLAEGDYYLIVKTDVTNAFYETNEENNTTCSLDPFTVTLRALPFNTDVADVLYNDGSSDFRLDVGDNLNQTVRIHLTSEDSLAGAMNMIYATYNDMGDNLNYTYSTIGQYTANPELYIPSTNPGYYGVSIFGNTPASNEQNTVVRADILPFELRSVDADHGGNTGEVTVELTGSHFRPDMKVCLRNESDTICADSLIYVNYYQAFARFDLTGRTPGMYDVSAANYCEGESVLYNGFEIQTGEPGGLAYNLIFPSAPRPSHNVVLMLEFSNLGNTDLHDQVLEISSLTWSPIALTPEGIAQGNQTLLVPLTIEGQPQGLLRPGCYGTINIYCFTSGGLVFTLKPANE